MLQRMKKEGIKSPDRAEALMLAFADYYPEIKKTTPKTWQQKWIEHTERKPREDDPWKNYAAKAMKEDQIADGDGMVFLDENYGENLW